jgi:hypothetical protein
VIVDLSTRNRVSRVRTEPIVEGSGAGVKDITFRCVTGKIGIIRGEKNGRGSREWAENWRMFFFGARRGSIL